MIAGAALLGLTTDVIELLEPFVTRAGELLPLRFTGSDTDERMRRLFALNILEDVDCLDVNRSAIRAGELRLNFIPHRLPESGLFKVPQCDWMEILCLERDDETDTFRSRMESEDLRGVEFELLWTSSGGAIARGSWSAQPPR